MRAAVAAARASLRKAILLRRLGVPQSSALRRAPSIGLWPSFATSSRGTRCSTPAAPTSGSSARSPSTRASRSMVALPDDLHPDVRRGAAQARHRLPVGAPGRCAAIPAARRRRSSPPARRPASRCASSSRRSTCSRATPARGRSTCTRRRRSPRTRRGRCNALAVKRARPAIYDGDTPREQRADAAPAGQPDPHQPGHAAPRDPPEPRRRGATSSRTSRSSWSTRRTSTAACSARTSPTCCGGCGGSARCTAPTPRFLLASATIANPGELASRLTGLDDVTVIDRDGSPGTKRTIAMWNPPITDPATAARRSPLAEAADLLAELVIEGARTIVFMKSRKAVELMARFASLELQAARASRRWPSGSRRTGRATRPQQRRELERRLVGRRAARRRVDGCAGAGDRHRRAGRGDLRDVPGDGRLAAPDVGPRGAARPRAGDLHRRRGRARPVLLPPPGRVPRAAGRGRDPRPRERAAVRRAPAVRRARGAAGGRRRGDARVRAGASSPSVLVGEGELRERPDGTFVPRRADEFPASRGVAAQRRAATRWRSSTPAPAR